jgi:hypothetical protein
MGKCAITDCLSGGVHPKFPEDNYPVAFLGPMVFQEGGSEQMQFSPNEAKRLLKTRVLLFFIVLESQEVLENKEVLNSESQEVIDGQRFRCDMKGENPMSLSGKKEQATIDAIVANRPEVRWFSRNGDRSRCDFRRTKPSGY